jgi:hypothetical protein
MVNFMVRVLYSLRRWQVPITMEKNNKKHSYYSKHCPSVDNAQSQNHIRVSFNTSSSEIFKRIHRKDFCKLLLFTANTLFVSGKNKRYLTNVGEKRVNAVFILKYRTTGM